MILSKIHFWRWRSFFLFLSFTLAGVNAAWSQDLYTAPNQSAVEKIRELLNDTPSQTLSVTLKTMAFGENNLVPLSWLNRNTYPVQWYSNGTAFFQGYMVDEVKLSKGNWRLSYSSEDSSLFNANPSGAKLFLYAMSGMNGSLTAPDAKVTMNRVDGARTSLAYVTSFGNSPSKGHVRFAVDWWALRRVQYGSLMGSMQNGVFDGTLDLITSRGLNDPAARDYAISFDTSVSYPLSNSLSLGVWFENLFSQAWLGSLQEIKAHVVTNTLVPDAQGFLHAPPVLSGSDTTVTSHKALWRRMDIGAAWHSGRCEWIGFLSHDRNWQCGIGLSKPAWKGARWTAMTWEDPFLQQIGLQSGSWNVEFGASSLDFNRVRDADVMISFRIAPSNRF